MRSTCLRPATGAALLAALLSLSPVFAREVQEQDAEAQDESAQADAAETSSDPWIEVEEQKELPHEARQSLSTTLYQPSKLEQPHLAIFKPEDMLPGSMTVANVLEDRVGQPVSWFGIVREDKWVRASRSREGRHELLIEHKYFDGLTDSHQQIVSFAGAGDFKAILPFAEKELPFKTLTLVRCYGEVSSEKRGVPTLEVSFVRAWPWNNFAFMGGLESEATPDRTNKRWRKRIKLPDNLYSAAPDSDYYEQLLGKRKK